jgi:hypothetical protein
MTRLSAPGTIGAVGSMDAAEPLAPQAARLTASADTAVMPASRRL